jgi:hypothetical protein
MPFLRDTVRRFRSRTTEMGPFWAALSGHGHDPHDSTLMGHEWAWVEIRTARYLIDAGLTCSRHVEACPDWLLKTVPGLGPVAIAALRKVFPYRRDVFRTPVCAAKQTENQRWLDRNTHDTADAIARKAWAAGHTGETP